MTNTNLTTHSLKPKIYVACLAAYNAGYLHGVWIDATTSRDFMLREIRTMLNNSPIPHAEEWAIHDYEDFGSIHLEEYSGLDTVVAMVDIIKEHGELGAAVIAYYRNCMDEAKNALEHYCGEYESEADYAEQLMHECHDVPEYLQSYIDYDKVAHDLFVGDYYSIDVNGKCHVFNHA